MKRLLSIAVMVSALVSVASAQFTLNTLFTGGFNGQGTQGNVNYMDIVTGPLEITITGWDWHLQQAAGTVFNVSIWTMSGTAAGNETNEAPWSLASVGTGLTGGPNGPSAITQTTPIVLAPNTTTGLMTAVGINVNLSHSGGDGNATYGSGTNQTYTDGRVTLLAGASLDSPWNRGGQGLNVPRIPNVNMHYDAVPEPASMAVLGLGVLALLRRRKKA